MLNSDGSDTCSLRVLQQDRTAFDRAPVRFAVFRRSPLDVAVVDGVRRDRKPIARIANPSAEDCLADLLSSRGASERRLPGFDWRRARSSFAVPRSPSLLSFVPRGRIALQEGNAFPTKN